MVRVTKSTSGREYHVCLIPNSLHSFPLRYEDKPEREHDGLCCLDAQNYRAEREGGWAANQCGFRTSRSRRCSEVVIWLCYGLNICVPPPNSYVVIHTKGLDDERGSLTKGTRALNKTVPRKFLSPPTTQAHRQKTAVWNGSSPDTQCAGPLILASSVSRTMRNKLLLFVRHSVL